MTKPAVLEAIRLQDRREKLFPRLTGGVLAFVLTVAAFSLASSGTRGSSLARLSDLFASPAAVGIEESHPYLHIEDVLPSYVYPVWLTAGSNLPSSLRAVGACRLSQRRRGPAGASTAACADVLASELMPSAYDGAVCADGSSWKAPPAVLSEEEQDAATAAIADALRSAFYPHPSLTSAAGKQLLAGSPDLPYSPLSSPYHVFFNLNTSKALLEGLIASGWVSPSSFTEELSIQLALFSSAEMTWYLVTALFRSNAHDEGGGFDDGVMVAPYPSSLSIPTGYATQNGSMALVISSLPYTVTPATRTGTVLLLFLGKYAIVLWLSIAWTLCSFVRGWVFKEGGTFFGSLSRHKGLFLDPWFTIKFALAVALSASLYQLSQASSSLDQAASTARTSAAEWSSKGEFLTLSLHLWLTAADVHFTRCRTWAIVTVLLAGLHLFDRLRLHPKLAVASRSLGKALSDASHFAVIFDVLLCMFAAWGHIAFGSPATSGLLQTGTGVSSSTVALAAYHDWSTLPAAFISCLRLIMYDYDYHSLLSTSSASVGGTWAAHWFFISFGFIMTNLVFWAFLAVIFDAYSLTRAEDLNQRDRDCLRLGYFDSLTLFPWFVRVNVRRARHLCARTSSVRKAGSVTLHDEEKASVGLAVPSTSAPGAEASALYIRERLSLQQLIDALETEPPQVEQPVALPSSSTSAMQGVASSLCARLSVSPHETAATEAHLQSYLLALVRCQEALRAASASGTHGNGEDDDAVLFTYQLLRRTLRLKARVSTHSSGHLRRPYDASPLVSPSPVPYVPRQRSTAAESTAALPPPGIVRPSEEREPRREERVEEGDGGEWRPSYMVSPAEQGAIE